MTNQKPPIYRNLYENTIISLIYRCVCGGLISVSHAEKSLKEYQTLLKVKCTSECKPHRGVSQCPCETHVEPNENKVHNNNRDDQSRGWREIPDQSRASDIQTPAARCVRLIPVWCKVDVLKHVKCSTPHYIFNKIRRIKNGVLHLNAGVLSFHLRYYTWVFDQIHLVRPRLDPHNAKFSLPAAHTLMAEDDQIRTLLFTLRWELLSIHIST